MKILQAKAIRGGVAMGRLWQAAPPLEIKRELSEDAQAETGRLLAAMAKLLAVMDEELQAAGPAAKEILAAQRELLTDSAYEEAWHRALSEQHYTAAYGALAAGEELAAEFAAVENEYIRARAEDVRQVARRLAETIAGRETAAMPSEPVILVAEEFTPAQLAAWDKSRLLGLVAAQGSPTSHTAILATNYGLPYLVGVDLAQVENGAQAVLDGEGGRLLVSPEEDSIAWAEARLAEEKALLAEAPRETRMKVYANISSLADLEGAAEADGIGLFRTEFLFMNREAAPDEAEQLEIYRTAVEKMGGREVIIRTIDVGTDKKVPYLGLPQEENPQLGLRGVRVSLARPELFRVQLRALLQAAQYGKLGVMFPMITSAKEIRAIKEQVKLAEAELAAEGKGYRRPRLGIMIETPAAAVCSEELAELVDFFSIGSNDLTQYTLALDRQGAGLEDYYEPLHEALFKLIRLTVEGAHARGATVGLCGELGSNEKALPRLVELGLDEVSVGGAMVAKVRRMVAKAEAATREDIPAEAEGIAAPVDGRLIRMEDIPDDTFAQGVLGQCFAVEPESGLICAPVSGTVVTIAETKHAVVVRDAHNRQVLVHIGINTVKLGGGPFRVKVSEGQQVSRGELLIEADLDAIRAAGCSTVTPVVLLEDEA